MLANSVVFLPRLRGTLPAGALAPGAPGAQADHGSVRPALVHENQAPRVEPTHPLAPARPTVLVALGG